MIRHWSRGMKTRSERWQARGRRARRRGGRRHWGPEGLEDRVLLSGPTVYTVTDASGTASDPGSLSYAVLEPNGTQNPAGSLIQFDPTFFNAATLKTITLASTLTLSETGGPEVIDGPDEVGSMTRMNRPSSSRAMPPS